MTIYICANCGEGSASWIGKCPSCNEWDTFKRFNEGSDEKGQVKKTLQPFNKVSFNKINSHDNKHFATGLYEFDRVLGGGLMPGSVILLTGEPGVGKSTLLLQGLKNLNTLYISGEESAEQVKERADRLKLNLDSFQFSDTLQVESIFKGVNELKNKPSAIVIDSIQTIYSKNIESPPGTVTQLRASTSQLIRLAKETRIPIIIVGHVTKDGDIAGPKTLEHMVDAVYYFEGERVSSYRILRANKNRYGSTEEIGIFEMKGNGLEQIDNPLVFIDKQSEGGTSGKTIAGVVEGKRPLFFEIQALVSPTYLAIPKRVVKGVDYNKVLLLLAVMQKNLNLNLNSYDIFINVVGGVNIKSTSSDLAVVAAIISSIKSIQLSSHALFTGEIGLLGEVRSVYGQDRILNEAKRLKFDKIFSNTNIKTIKQLYSALK